MNKNLRVVDKKFAKYVKVIRVSAVLIENEDPVLSQNLITIALAIRPGRIPLVKKFEEYNRDLGRAADIGELTDSVLVDALLKLEKINMKAALELAPLVHELLPDNEKLKSYAARMEIIQEFKKTNDYLTEQVELLRNKFNQIHEALNYSDLLKIKEIDDPAAKLSAVEIIDKGAEKTLLVFGGMATRPSMPPKEFFKSFSEKDMNIVFVKDFKQCWYQNGLVGKSHDVESTIRVLGGLIPPSTKNLICLGTSAGGYAAIRFGVELNADRIIAFAPQTLIGTQVFKRFKSADSRIEEVDINSPDFDLAKILSVKPHGNIEVHFGQFNEADSAAADHIKEYVNLYPYPFKGHGIAAYLKGNGTLKEILSTI